MGDIFGVLLTFVLLAANAFFVGSEFALISARRDRLEALAEQGKKSAVTVIRAGENLSLMLAGAQLGITICSILLGRVAEPAVAHLLEEPFGLLGIPDALLHTVSFMSPSSMNSSACAMFISSIGMSGFSVFLMLFMVLWQ